MAEIVRKKIKWATKKRNGRSRKWKTRYIIVVKGGAKPAEAKPAEPKKDPAKK